MDEVRRRLLVGATVAGGAALAAAMQQAEAQQAAAPPKPTLPPIGKPGEFDFLTGHWKIHNKRRIAPGKWDEYPGESTCWSILGGTASIEELRIPVKDFSGMGLRLLDQERKVWLDYWSNAKVGVLGSEGTAGVFVDGVGSFISEDAEDGKPVQWRGVWDRITKDSCRWYQGASRDGGKTWDDTWFMDWTRA